METILELSAEPLDATAYLESDQVIDAGQSEADILSEEAAPVWQTYHVAALNLTKQDDQYQLIVDESNKVLQDGDRIITPYCQLVVHLRQHTQLAQEYLQQDERSAVSTLDGSSFGDWQNNQYDGFSNPGFGEVDNIVPLSTQADQFDPLSFLGPGQQQAPAQDTSFQSLMAPTTNTPQPQRMQQYFEAPLLTQNDSLLGGVYDPMSQQPAPAAPAEGNILADLGISQTEYVPPVAASTPDRQAGYIDSLYEEAQTEMLDSYQNPQAAPAAQAPEHASLSRSFFSKMDRFKNKVTNPGDDYV